MRGLYLGPASRAASKLVEALMSNRILKNEVYHPSMFARLAGLSSRNTFKRYIEDPDNLYWFNQVLIEVARRHGLYLKVSCQPMVKYGIRLEGCKLGPLGLTSYPLLPRFVSHLRNRPRTLLLLASYALARPQLFAVNRPLKDKVSRWLLDQLTRED
jgi:hypothetical protein